MKYLNLYVQTEYSMLNSYVKVDDYIKYAKSNNINALSICDDNTYAYYKFYKKCLKNNIKPILGLRIRVGEDSFVLAYAYNKEGYGNLLKLSSKAMFGENIDESLCGLTKGLIIVFPYLENETIREYKKIDFVDHLKALNKIYDYFFVGVSLPTDLTDKRMFELDDLCKINGIPTVLLNKTLFLEKEDYEIYEVLRKISENNNKLELGDEYKSYYFKNDIVLTSITNDRIHLLNNLDFIERACNVSIDDSGYKFPKYDKDGKEVEADYLDNLAKAGLNKRLKGQNVSLDVYRERLLYELDVIKRMGFSDYFLIVYDYVRYCKTHGILVGPGRGSAAGSLVGYALGITNIDPLKYDLLFERFLNPERSSMPDIDVDFPDDRREEVISYIAKRFGNNRVAHLNAFGTFGAKSALRDVGKALGIDPQRVAIISNNIAEKNPDSLFTLYNDNDDIKKICESDEDIDKLFKISMKIEGVPRHITTHASGVVIAPSDITDYSAIQKGPNGVLQTQYEADDIGDIGLVKMDILGLRNLNTIQLIIDNVLKRTGDKVDFYNIPLDDKMTFELLAKADTDGVFQLESTGMKNTMLQIGINKFTDIVDCLALFRPGPMQYIPMYSERKKGKKYSIPSDKLASILCPTYGIIVYQEQIMQIANVVASYSLGEADILRRGVSKKKEEILLEEQHKFIERGKLNGYSENVLNNIYDDIVKFAGYGFNKSHAVVYGYISYVLAYLKAHYLAEFSSALMDNEIGNDKKMTTYIMAAKSCGINIMPPDINISNMHFVTKGDNIYFPLSAIAQVGPKTALAIIEERNNGEYLSFEDFVARTKDIINKKVFLMLCYSGAFDSLGITRKSACEAYDSVIMRYAFVSSMEVSKLKPLSFSDEEYSFSDISEFERNALGMNIKFDEFIKYKPLFSKYKATDLNTFISSNKQNGLVICKVSRIKEITTKKNTLMGFFSLNDDTYSCEAVAFADDYFTIKGKIKEGSVCLLSISSRSYGDDRNLVLKNALDITV